MNKKVTPRIFKEHLPVISRSLPIFCGACFIVSVFLTQKTINAMTHKDHFPKRDKELHPQIGFGLFLITFGLAMLVATNDLLNLGSVRDYFTWETMLVFIGVLLLLNLQFAGGLVLIAIGSWFFIENRDYQIPELVRTIYWPSLIILIGISFIISSIFKRNRKQL